MRPGPHLPVGPGFVLEALSCCLSRIRLFSVSVQPSRNDLGLIEDTAADLDVGRRAVLRPQLVEPRDRKSRRLGYLLDREAEDRVAGRNIALEKRFKLVSMSHVVYLSVRPGG